MDEIWNMFYDEALKVLKPRKVSKMHETAGVAAAVESILEKNYVDVCVDGGCTLGICAERNAIFSMLTNGEDALKHVIAVNSEEKHNILYGFWLLAVIENGRKLRTSLQL